MKLSELAVGESAFVVKLCCHGVIRRRMCDLGICTGVRIECIGASPLADPRAYLVRGKSVALRNVEARGILVHPASSRH